MDALIPIEVFLDGSRPVGHITQTRSMKSGTKILIVQFPPHSDFAGARDRQLLVKRESPADQTMV